MNNASTANTKEKASQKTEPKEFTHIEVRVIRNPEWLKPHERQGFFLSECFPLEDYELPDAFANMTEGELNQLKQWIRAVFNGHTKRIE